MAVNTSKMAVNTSKTPQISRRVRTPGTVNHRFQRPRAILSGQIDAAWASIDADGSGGTDYDEFREWWNSAAGRCGWLPAATAF